MPAAKHTIAQIEEALLKHHGNISAAARALGSERSALTHRVSHHKRLQKARDTAKETMVDMAESALWQLVRDKNLTAVIFSLKCQGRDRGWIDTPRERGIDDTPPESGKIEYTTEPNAEDNPE